MPKVSVQAGDNDEVVGKFEFDQLPRVGEGFSVPCAGDAAGMRSFVVKEVYHLAAGVDGGPLGEAPLTMICAKEIR